MEGRKKKDDIITIKRNTWKLMYKPINDSYKEYNLLDILESKKKDKIKS